MNATPALPRRTVVAGLTATGAGLATAAGAVTAAQAADQHQVFQHGVASGDPLADAVVLWTRVTPTPEAVPAPGRGRASV